MRKTFEQQMALDIVPINDLVLDLKCRDASVKIGLALLEIFNNEEYSKKLFTLLESHLMKNKQLTGRTGMDLWQIFVMAQFRLGLNMGFDRLQHAVNNDRMIRVLLGVETTSFTSTRKTFAYQTIVDNIRLLDDEILREINQTIVAFGHDTFKKKEEEQLCLKSDSYVIESNVHFPTDYNLLWDCCRKMLDFVGKFTVKYPEIQGWRKLHNWRKELKNASRNVGQVSGRNSKNKEELLKTSVTEYLKKAQLLVDKVEVEKENFPLKTMADLALLIELERFVELTKKHIDLLRRRVLEGEKIPQNEKMFSVFETYTEWINKGKKNPNVELGKNTTITTDQYNLIVDYKIMNKETDSEVVIEVADRVLLVHSVKSWSFDKGFYNKDNKSLLQTAVALVVMPKKGKCNKAELAEEHEKEFKKLRNKHSAVESNINELEHRGLNRCPDRGYEHFTQYVGIGVCAYNLHKIGAKLLKDKAEKPKKRAMKVAA